MSNNKNESMWNSILSDNYNEITVYEYDKELACDLLTPKEIMVELNKIVIGQQKAKEALSIAIYNRLLALNNYLLDRDTNEYYFEKTNLLMIGHTGCGKTHLLKALANIVSLPIAIQDATTFTSAGYVGRDIHESVEALFDSAGKIIDRMHGINILSKNKIALTKKLVEYGIVYIDEADKIKTNFNERGKDVNGKSVQEAFLKLIEGTEIKIKTETYKGTIDTSNILFVFGGAFSDIEKIISARLNVKQIGFIQDTKVTKDAVIQQTTIKDLVDYGLLPELVGRLSNIVVLDTLDRDTIYRIFTEPRYCIMSQVINEFKSYGANVSFTDEVIEHIVDKAIELKLGARGLRAVCQNILRKLYYHLPSSVIQREIIITKDCLDQLASRRD